MASSTSLTAETLRIKNRSTGRAMWLVVDDSGTLQTSEVSLDVNYAPDFLTAPIAEATPAQENGGAFVIGRAYNLTFIFDGNLGVGSTVGLQAPTGGVVTGISISGSHINFTYTPAAVFFSCLPPLSEVTLTLRGNWSACADSRKKATQT